MEKTVSIEKKTIEIEERGVKLRLTVVDTPGKCDAELRVTEDWRSEAIHLPYDSEKRFAPSHHEY